jgi:hypothetical protein
MGKKFTLFAGLFLALSSNNLMASDVVVDPSVTTLPAAYAAASSGDVLILMDGTYVIDANITMTKAITVKAQNTKMAVIKGAGFAFSTNSSGNLTVKDVVLDGTKTAASTYAAYVVDFTASAYPLAVNNVLFENCTITNYGNCFLRANRGECTCESFKVNNCIIKNNGAVAAYPFFQVAKTKFGAGSLELTNSTISNFNNEYIQSYGTTAGADNSATYLFKNNTFYKTVTNSARKPFLFNSGTVKIQNNIFALSATDGVRLLDVTINAAVTSTEFTNNTVYNYGSGDLFTFTGWTTASGNINANPQFTDPDNGNFTLPTGSTLATANIGDPRWFATVTAVNAPVSSTLISYNGTEIKLNKTQDVYVYSTTGSLLMSAKQVNTLSVSNLSKGIYVAKTGLAVQKFIVR